MKFADPLVSGTLLLREKRFLAHVRLESGQEVVAHTNNSGRMTGCAEPGSRVWLSPADRPGRKLKWTWELVEVEPGVLVGINTILPNKLVAECIAAGRVPQLGIGWSIRPEARYGEEGSRVDLLLERERAEDCGLSLVDELERVWVEVKNVTLVREGVAAFPDAPTARGRKHLRELRRKVVAGDRAMLIFVVQRSDAREVVAADDIDPEYGEELRRAREAGVEVLAWMARVSPSEVVLERALPVTGILRS